MFKVENILLLLIVIVCFLVSLVLVMLVIKPEIFPSPVYASEAQEEELIPVKEISDEDWQVYRNEGFAFEISYPNTVIQKSAPDQGALNAGVGVSPGTPVWQFRLDDMGNYQGTNLIDASLVIHVGNQEGDTSRCSEFKPGSINKIKLDALPVIEINGISFWQDVVQEGVMGGTYYLVSYRTVSQGACYEITQVIQSSNQESFAGESISTFDMEKVTGELDKVLGTFKFLDVNASFPPQSYPEPKDIRGVVDESSTEHVDGLDVSHWQGDINWTKVALNDYIFTFAKGTEGVGWTDVNFFTNINEGTEAGVVMGVYHFARPDLGNTGQEEAEYFLSVVGDYLESGYLRPVLDLEVGSYLGKEALSAWVLDWLQTVENQSGVAPLIYTNYNYVSYFLTDPVADFDLWIAYWNCNPTPTYDIPPTGMWSDWGFWQYCVKSAGFVPGIHTPIDVNIFNGVEEGLSEFDAASPLWVSLTNYTTAASAPHYADITADVNGDAVGTINYAFWWDCTSLEVDITTVNASCGTLPTPAEGECLENEYGVSCSSVAEEVKMVEHTYQEIGDFTAKVIVERDSAPPAEDRYQITVYNPILSFTADPVSPAVGKINQPFELTASVVMKTSISGALQVDLIEDGTGIIKGSGCQTVPDDAYVTRNYDFSLTDSEVIVQNYTLWARYRSGSDCPVTDTNPNDLSLPYKIEWTFGDTDISVFRPSTMMWYIKDQYQVKYGISGDIPVPGDYDGDGDWDVAVFRPSTGRWYIKDQYQVNYGMSGDIPVPGDYDGDGDWDVAVFRPSIGTWLIKDQYQVKYGISGDIPEPGDYDGDGDWDVAVFRPSTGRWLIKDQYQGHHGMNGDIPVPSDYDGNGDWEVAVFRPSTVRWYIKDQYQVNYGMSGDIPVPGDYDGDGDLEVAVFRPSTGKWYVKDQYQVEFGMSGDIPVPGDYDGLD